MNIQRFAEAMNDIDGRYLTAALNYRRAAQFRRLLKWGSVAACLGLLLCGSLLFPRNSQTPDAGGGAELGGLFPDGVDPVIASIAIYPDTEVVQDVETATLDSLDEQSLYQTTPLCDYLPTKLPDGYHPEQANLYETTMKNGVKHHLLRVVYANADKPRGQTVETDDGIAEIAPIPDDGYRSILICIFDCQPRNISRIYSPKEIDEQFFRQNGQSHCYISYGDIYVGIFRQSASDEEITEFLRQYVSR